MLQIQRTLLIEVLLYLTLFTCAGSNIVIASLTIMTKRKRTPPPSPPPRASVLQIPASLQRLSVLSRSLAYQSDKLADSGQDAKNAHTVAHAQVLDGTPSAVTAFVTMTSPNGQIQGFKAFAPSKQPSFPDTQTWVAPKPRAVPMPDAAGFMPPTQPSFPQGQAWPQPQPRKVVNPPLRLAPAPVAPQTTPIRLEPAPMNSEPLCLETQPHSVAALIAQKRAANEASRKREAWTRKASQHRRWERPDDQLLDELNQTLEPPSTQGTPTPGAVSTARHPGSGASPPGQFVTPTPAITFDPTVPNAATPAENSWTASQPAPRPNFKPSTRRPRTHPDQISLFSSAESTTAPTESLNRFIPQQPRQNSLDAQLYAPAKTAPAQPPARVSQPAHPQPIQSNLNANAQSAAASLARQQQHSKQSGQASAGYYRFDPRHWQTSSTNHQQQGSHRVDPALLAIGPTQSTPKGRANNTAFRNLTKDKFGKLGPGGTLTEMPVGQKSGGGQ